MFAQKEIIQLNNNNDNNNNKNNNNDNNNNSNKNYNYSNDNNNNVNHFFSSLDTGETRTMDSKSNNLDILIGSETDDIIEGSFKSFLPGYQEELKKNEKEQVCF